LESLGTELNGLDELKKSLPLQAFSGQLLTWRELLTFKLT
jgi:hypothetical protein